MGSAIHRPGQPVEEVLYVLEGLVELRGGGRALRQQGPRTIVGWLTALSRAADGPEVIALEATTALALHREDLVELFDDNIELLLFAVRNLLEARRILPGCWVSTARGTDSRPASDRAGRQARRSAAHRPVRPGAGRQRH